MAGKLGMWRTSTIIAAIKAGFEVEVEVETNKNLVETKKINC